MSEENSENLNKFRLRWVSSIKNGFLTEHADKAPETELNGFSRVLWQKI